MENCEIIYCRMTRYNKLAANTQMTNKVFFCLSGIFRSLLRDTLNLLKCTDSSTDTKDHKKQLAKDQSPTTVS